MSWDRKTGSAIERFESRFRKPVTSRDSDYENRWNAERVASRGIFFVNGSRRGLLDSRFRTLIPESFSFSFFTKSWSFLRKRQSRRLARCCLQGIENSLSLQLVASVILIFSNLARQQTAFTGNSTELFVWIFVLQKSVKDFGNRASLTARQRSLDFRLCTHGFRLGIKAKSHSFS